jgi:hypothetical protein
MEKTLMRDYYRSFLIGLLTGVALGQSSPSARPLQDPSSAIAISARPVVKFEHFRHDVPPPPRVPWAGLVEIALTNRSAGMVRMINRPAIWDYQVEIEDVSGEPVPLTELAKKMAGKNPDMMHLPTGVYDHVPAEDWRDGLDVSLLYQIKPGHGYKVTLIRWRGLWVIDAKGKVLKNGQIGCRFEVSELGVLRDY